MPRRSGKLVKLSDGRKGITYNDLPTLGGRYQIYIVDDNFKETGAKVLKCAEDLTVIGFVD